MEIKVGVKVGVFCQTACAALLAGMISLAASAEVPEYYRILADDYEFPNTGVVPGKNEPTLWKPSDADRRNGFAAALANTEEPVSPHWIWRDTNPDRTLRFISQLSEFRAQPIAVRMLRPVKGFSVECSALVDEAGNRIDPENWDVRVVKNLYFDLENGRQQDSNLLMKAGSREWPADFTAYYWLTIYTPQETKPGLYTGSVTLRTAGGGEQRMPVVMRVLDKSYQPPAGAWGMWIPAHFYRESKGYCRNYAPKWWTSDRIVDYFRFWKTRGFTSPTYSSWYPEIALVDGKIQIDFTEMDQFITAPGRAGLTGQPVIGDALLFEYWAHAAAQEIKNRFGGKIPETGALGLRSDEAYTCNSSGKPYGELEAELFTRIVKQVFEHGRQTGWPQVILYPEEEIGNQPFKEAGYDFFMPILQKTVGPLHCITTDNNIGHMNDRLDRGKRDGSYYRSYNDWDQQAIDDARKDKAVIWTFNRGFLRSAWGHYLQRIGATGSHQWADCWDGGSYGVWFNSITAGNGKVMTSVNYERAALGLRDLALMRELEKLGPEYAEELRQINDLVRMDLVHTEGKKYYQGIKDGELEARRWQTLLALGRAGRVTIPDEPQTKPLPAIVSTELLEEKSAFETADGPWLQSCESTEMKLDGRKSERAYQRPEALATEFHWTEEQEARYRSQAASDEDFARYRPLPYRVAVAHDARGLYFHFEADSPEFSALARNRKHNDVAMWEDDCFDLFLQPPGSAAAWQVIFNTADQVLLLKAESQMVPDSGIKVVTIPNADGMGYQQEVFIPYSALELEGMPPSGTVWKFNVGRELPLRGQYTTWSQVIRNFGIGRGHLKFVDPSPEIVRLAMGNGKRGRNLLEGKVTKANAVVELYSPAGKEYRTQSAADGTFRLAYSVTDGEAGSWKLKITGPDGSVWRDQSFEVAPLAEKVVSITGVSPVAVSGGRIYVDVEFALGNAETGFPVHVRLLDRSGRGVEARPFRSARPEAQRLYLDTTGVPAGEYQIQVYSDDPAAAAVSEQRCRILPAAW